jgi:hypothetical protein
VDMWTIGFADRLRFPRFPSKLGKRGNARLRPHAHRRHSRHGYTLRSGSGCRTFGVHLSKFVGAPWLSKLLNKISFLSGSAESAGRTGSFIDGKLSRG